MTYNYKLQINTDRNVDVEEIELKKARSWYLVDERNVKGMTEIFSEKLDATNEDEAVKEAAKVWYRLSDHDKKLRKAFYIGKYDEDEDGEIDVYDMVPGTYADVLEIVQIADRIKTAGEDKEQALMELAGEMNEMIALGWEEEEAHEDEDAFLERLGDYAEDLTLEEIWQTWKNVWEIRKEV